MTLNERGVGKIDDFQQISRRISESVRDRAKVTIDDGTPLPYALSVGSKINDLG